MITLTDLDAAKLHQRELLREAHRAQLGEAILPSGPSPTARLVHAILSWLLRPLDAPESEDHPWPRLERYPYGARS
jgi:hypothetical protein